MNENLNELHERLTRATALAGSPDASLDEQTASLREAWLAFGQLLETAQSAADRPVRLAVTAPRRRRRIERAVLALAACLLIAASALWVVQAVRRSLDSGLPDAIVAENQSERTVPGTKVQGASPEADLAWEDPLDSEIIQAGQAVLSVREDVLGLADASHSVEYGLQQVDKEIQNEPL
ncbi:MAG: hypothetical protein ACYC35_17815 [Pirellulales bacterium]